MKNKLNLSLDDLSVETFATAADDKAPRGTVQGHAFGTDGQMSDGGVCDTWYCGGGGGGYPSAGVTCKITGYNFCVDNPCRIDY